MKSENSALQSTYVSGVSNFKITIFYYGWLNTSNVLDLRFDILVFGGADEILNY